MRSRSLLLLILNLAILSAILALRSHEAAPDPILESQAFFATQEPHFRPRPFTQSPAGLANIRAETCGYCHQAIYEEWQASTHARAWLDDAQYQAELQKHRGSPGHPGDTSWICVNCHTPLMNQLPRLVVGLEQGLRNKPIWRDNPAWDPKLQLEAITCAGCHVRDGLILGPCGDTDAPHPVRRAPELLESQLCTSCHQARANEPEVSLACALETGADYENGPAPSKGQTCQSCHMPAVERLISERGSRSKRKTRRHGFGGSLIPKRPQDQAAMAICGQDFPEGVEAKWLSAPTRAKVGERLSLRAEIFNKEAGHPVPTGDPERYLLLTLEVLDSAGALLARRVEKIGTTYEWSPLKKIQDNRLAPGERRIYEISLEVPKTPRLQLRLIYEKYRISPENLHYHKLEGQVIPSRLVQEELRTIQVRSP